MFNYEPPGKKYAKELMKNRAAATFTGVRLNYGSTERTRFYKKWLIPECYYRTNPFAVARGTRYVDIR